MKSFWKRQIATCVVFICILIVMMAVVIINAINQPIDVPVYLGEEPALESSTEDDFSITHNGQTMQVSSYLDRDDFATIVDQFQSSGLDYQAVCYTEVGDYLAGIFLTEAEIHELADEYDEGCDELKIVSNFPCGTESTSAKILQDTDGLIVRLSVTRADIEQALQEKANSYAIETDASSQGRKFRFVIDTENLQSIYDEIDRRSLQSH